jgi:hypothetical protein
MNNRCFVFFCEKPKYQRHKSVAQNELPSSESVEEESTVVVDKFGRPLRGNAQKRKWLEEDDDDVRNFLTFVYSTF